jgi:hypothetical protein
MSIAGFVAWLKNWSDTRGRKGLLLRVAEDGEVSVQRIDIPYGQVILVTKDGQWLRYEDTDPEKLSDLVTKLAGGLVPDDGTPTSPAEVGAGGAGDAPAGDQGDPAEGEATPANGDDPAR